MLATSLALAFSLSMDSFAAALGRGACSRRNGLPEAVRVGAAFGICQFAMPLVGWGVGIAFASLVESVDHWIAFGLLLAVGGAMLRNAVMDDGDEVECGPERSVRSEWLALLTTAVATSIDAAAVGAGLALVDVDMVTTSALIGAVTFAVAFGGVLIGRAAGARLGRWAEMAGGAVLIGLGAKILLEHTLG
ncbi:manganese efflux pump MntP [Azospirillum picis]|uniref:Putative manganese efflux pump MntP n=1 Tax=Azospirillum picis TaxID=488438 RepID=A0ABU0MD20_9PROT|nr:manganese efflux pump MntP family protein [Azospirillum picis]MBP2297647.1 putative Mn2+ efflux pump MntP [Azospirillum picis]MDQ0531330.1 putative Mn2+ efflux pump MntP [Azospirillum picis]